jgi:histidinol-phosphate/aromatic aminotransferase/cobyric acid decarboxylase-like protein
MHGGDIYEFAEKNRVQLRNVLDFSASINDFISVKNMIIKKELIENYPEINLDKYKKILAGDEFAPENIALVPGLTSFIHKFMLSVNGNVVIVSPTFTEYLKPEIRGKKIIVPFDILNKNPDILKNYNFNALFLVYPDSPTGQIIDKNSFYSIIEIAMKKNSTLFLDESFIWFVNNREINEMELIEKYSNIIIGRSMTKVISMPGLRLGYIASNCLTIQKIEKSLEPWGINEIALAYLGSYTGNLTYLGKKTEIERNYVIKSLKNTGYQVIGMPRANYITFQLPENIDGKYLKKYLAENNIMIRLLDDYNEFGSNYMRIAIKRRAKNRILINALSAYTGEIHG